YAWNTQPMVGHWNLYRLAEALHPLVGEIAPLRAVLDQYESVFEPEFQQVMAAKLGLAQWQPDDSELLDELWRVMHGQRADFTQAFRRLAWAHTEAPDGAQRFEDLFIDPAPAKEWLERYRLRLERDPQSPQERSAAMLA